ncbi:unnamed protein product, partial [Phaeothamnion confervicola]
MTQCLARALCRSARQRAAPTFFASSWRPRPVFCLYFGASARPITSPHGAARFDRQFSVVEIDAAGAMRPKLVTLGEVMRRFRVHARDVIELGLQDIGGGGCAGIDGRDGFEASTPLILPRSGVIVVSLGHLKALVYEGACLLFDAQRPAVAESAESLADTLRHAAACAQVV